MNVLLVDDHDSLRRALTRLIRMGGYAVQSYRNVDALLASGIPEGDACLVLDVDLPGVSGIEFKRDLAATDRDLPTIFITALEPTDVSERLAALSPVAVLYKPFRNEDLLKAIGLASLTRQGEE